MAAAVWRRIQIIKAATANNAEFKSLIRCRGCIGLVATLDGGQDSQPSLTLGAFQNIHFKDLGHQRSPGIVAPSCGSGLCLVFAVAGRLRPRGCRRRHNGAPPFCSGTQHTVKTDEVHAGGRRESGQPRQQFEGFEQHVCCPVAPRRLQPVTQTSVRQLVQPFGSNGRTRRISAQTFQSSSVVFAGVDAGLRFHKRRHTLRNALGHGGYVLLVRRTKGCLEAPSWG